MREEVQRLISLGTLPPESASVSDIAERQALIGAIHRPLNLEEARALAQVLGTDDCFGLAWSIVHLIESAPGWSLEHVPSGNALFLCTLRSRILNAQAVQDGA